MCLNTLLDYQYVHPTTHVLQAYQLNCRFCKVDIAALKSLEPPIRVDRTDKNGKISKVVVKQKLGSGNAATSFCVQCFFLRDFPVCRAVCAACQSVNHEQIINLEIAKNARDPTRKANLTELD
jgi:hypothetical protein